MWISQALREHSMGARGAGRSMLPSGSSANGGLWWEDGAPDFNRHFARNTPYADWFATLDAKDS